MGTSRGITARLLAILLAAMALAGCRGGGNTPGEIGTAQRPLSMVFVPSVNAEELATSADELATLLETETGYKVKGSVGSSYAAVVEAMGAGHIDIGWLNPFSYVLARSKYGVEPLLITRRSGSSTYHAVIITRTDSGINSIQDLKGRKFAFVDPLSTSGTIYPKLAMMAAGIDPEQHLTQTFFAGGHDKVVIAVYQKQADAGAIYAGLDRDARDRVQGTIPDVLEKTKVIAKTDPIPNDNVSVRKELPEEVKEKIKAALQKIAATDAGRRILENYEIDGVEPVTDADYESIRKAALALNIDLEQAVQPKKG